MSTTALPPPPAKRPAAARRSSWPPAWLPERGLPRLAVELTVLMLVFTGLRMIPKAPDLLGFLEILTGLILAVCFIILAVRFVRERLLWSLRNKLLVTYGLIGLAPVVLFFTLVLISAYVAAGQFAIHVIDNRLTTELDNLNEQNNFDFKRTAHELDDKVPLERIVEHLEHPQMPPALDPTDQRRAEEWKDLQIQAYQDAEPLIATATPATVHQPHSMEKAPFGLPVWALQLPQGEFQGLVLDGRQLFLVAAHQRRLNNGRMLTVVDSAPINERRISTVARGLGRAGLLPLRTGTLTNGQALQVNRPIRDSRPPAHRPRSATEGPPLMVQGGEAFPAKNIADISVRFPSNTPIVDWETGERDSVPIQVLSRPTVLYQELFGSSLSGVYDTAIKTFLLSLTVIFCLLILLALWMAARLTKTMTGSVAELYAATQRIDRGDFEQRISVRSSDQMAALSVSFNDMTASLRRLLKEQKEKDRMQNELTIAQEVQANLFPRSDLSLPGLELHGICRPARSVSGDYYDFLVFADERQPRETRQITGLGLALGDISGKGISAALLMATLHSAVRAYRFASEELELEANNSDEDCTELFASPARILALLNRHLYRSTQPEKYATLFLAHYDAQTAILTYSNAGQLPPLLLRTDGSVKRLDVGGTVVGLMDGMHYEEERVQMLPGDLLIAYSDGVTEPENEFGDFGEDRLLEISRRYREQPLPVISSQVMQALDAWIGGEEQPDDITLVLARQL